MKSKFMLAGVAALATASVLSMTASAANAEPNPASPCRAYSTFGSDTTQDVWNGLSNGGPIADVASYNASGSTYVSDPCLSHHWLRPVGSGNGAKFLSAAYDTGAHTWAAQDVAPTVTQEQPTSADVAFSRSSSGPSVTGSDLTYIPFARDAVSVAFNKVNASDPTPNLTADQLKSIYGGPSAFVAGSGVTYTPVGSSSPTAVFLNGTQVFPYLPQSGSGTRQFFLGAIGLSNTFAFPSYVNTQESYLENNGGLIADTTSHDHDNSLVPFSAAQWIAQKNTATTGIANTIASDEDLATIGGVDPLNRSGSAPVPGALYGTKNAITGLYGTLSTSGYGVFARDTYNVIPSDRYTGGAHADATLVTDLTADLDTTAARSVISTYGFGNLNYRTVKLGGWLH
jgi:hypothetical protein